MATNTKISTQNDQHAIIQEIDAWINEINQRHLENKQGFPNFGKILEEFQQFCLDYFNDRPPEDADTVNALLFEDWEPLRYALMQHRVESYRDLLAKGYCKLDEFSAKLKDSLGVEIQEQQKMRTVIYFEKMAKAKRYPFRGVNLIGIPLSDGHRPDYEWMSIAHELGHLLYWNAHFNKQDRFVVPEPGKSFFEKEINDSVEGLAPEDVRPIIRQLLMDWSEEIFADIVGARIAGSDFADSAWDRVVTYNKTTAELFVNDGSHALAYITPYISHSIACPNQPFDESRWNSYNIDSAILEKTSESNPVSVKVLLDCVMAFTENINKRLQDIHMDIWKPDDPISSFKILKEFVKKNLDDSSGEALREALLQPRILERAEGWNCICGVHNDSKATYCIRCKRPKPQWPFFFFWR